MVSAVVAMSYWPFFYSIALQLAAISAAQWLAPRSQAGIAVLALFLEPIAVFVLCRRWIKPAMTGLETPSNRYRRLLRGVNIQLFALVFYETIGRMAPSVGWLATLLISAYGIYSVVTSGAPLPLRILLALWPLTLPLHFMVLYQWEMRHMTPETYLIPKDYVGRIKVTMGDPAGAPALFEGRRAILRVQPDGTLKTRLALHYPHYRELIKKWAARRRFFYEDKLGRRVELATPARSRPRHAPRDLLVSAPVFQLAKDGAVTAIEFEVLDLEEE